MKADAAGTNWDRWQQLAPFHRDNDAVWRKNADGTFVTDLDVTGVVAMREPNHFKVYFKRLINYKLDGVDYNLPLG